MLVINIYIHRPRQLNILLLGLDGAGKTEVQHVLWDKQRTDFTPTTGCSSESFVYDDTKVQLSELGGAQGIRDIWKYYYPRVSEISFYNWIWCRNIYIVVCRNYLHCSTMYLIFFGAALYCFKIIFAFNYNNMSLSNFFLIRNYTLSAIYNKYVDTVVLNVCLCIMLLFFLVQQSAK